MKTIFTLLPILGLIVLLIYRQQAGEGVRQGLTLSFRAVLPALFPAMVLSGMVGELAESLPFPPALTVWITSHLCGFPLGIRALTMSYRRGLLTQKQAVGLSACCANASPAFLIGFTGEIVLGSTQKGLLLFLGQVLISGFLFWISGALKEPIRREPASASCAHKKHFRRRGRRFDLNSIYHRFFHPCRTVKRPPELSVFLRLFRTLRRPCGFAAKSSAILSRRRHGGFFRTFCFFAKRLLSFRRAAADPAAFGGKGILWALPAGNGVNFCFFMISFDK